MKKVFEKFLDLKKNLLLKLNQLPKGFGKFYLVIIGFILFFIFYHIGYAKRIIPGVRIGSVFLGGMSYDEAVETFNERVLDFNEPITLLYEDKKYEIYPKEIGLEYNVEATITRAFELGRTGNFFRDTKDKLAGLIKTLRFKAYYTVDDDALSAKFAQIRGEINQQPREASFVLSGGELSTIPSIEGRKVSDQKMYDSVVDSIEYLAFYPKDLEVNLQEASVKEEHLNKVYSEVENIIFNPITIKYQKEESQKMTNKEEVNKDINKGINGGTSTKLVNKWELSYDQMLDFIDVRVGEEENAEVHLSKIKFDSYIKSLADKIDKLPRGEITSIEDEIVSGFRVIQNGQSLDREKLAKDFKEAFLNGKDEVFIKVDEVEELKKPSEYGIFTLLGKGGSRFTGSGDSRIHNLTLAASRTNGVLVPPGETYSFNKSVGDISGDTGYDSGYIISNGRTVLGEGGGVCQTSTTLFRAVLNSGLPVVTRYPHAYRVGYYELDEPVGFDASVYQPSLDFEFKNDTPNYILVESLWDLNNNSLTFNIYGTSDGRKVEISGPVVSNLVPPPEPLYQKTDELKEGITKQIDFSAWGSKVYFTRKVTRGGELMFEDTFSSSYQPWRAVYLVGNKKD